MMGKRSKNILYELCCENTAVKFTAQQPAKNIRVIIIILEISWEEKKT